MRRAVFLDRDGVLNAGVMKEGRPFAPTTVDDLQILPGVPDALLRLRAAGFALVVVTNQPDDARRARRGARRFAGGGGLDTRKNLRMWRCEDVKDLVEDLPIDPHSLRSSNSQISMTNP